MTGRAGSRTISAVIRNVCIHVENEQPLLADLYDLPTSMDAGLVCTNVRTMDGKRPVFIDQAGSTFFFPYHVVRFLEIPEPEMARLRTAGQRVSFRAVPNGSLPPADGGPGGADDAWADGGGAGDPGSLLPVAAPAGEHEPADDDLELEIDESLLQRIRDV